MEKIENNKNSKIMKKTWVVLIAMFLLTALTGVTNQEILTLAFVLCLALLFVYDNLYLAFPFMIFYNSFYGMIFGVSVARLFSLLMIANVVVRSNGKVSRNVKCIIPFLCYLIYVTIVLLRIDETYLSWKSFYIMLDIFACIYSIAYMTNDEFSIKSFFRVYIIVCFISFLSGTIADNTLGGRYDQYERFMGTFEDPNYMGLFFTIAIVALVILKLFDKRIRWIMIMALYLMMLTTISISAIIVNVVLWILYLIITGKIKEWANDFISGKVKLRVILIFVLIIITIVFSYNYMLENPDAKIIGDFIPRISEKIENWKNGAFEEATSGRMQALRNNFVYYKSGSILNILFGGIPVNVKYIHPDIIMASHNEYVDMLLNIGIVGTFIMLIWFVFSWRKHLKKYRETKEDIYLFMVMGKVIWMCYAFTLTMFLDYRFMLLFLM